MSPTRTPDVAGFLSPEISYSIRDIRKGFAPWLDAAMSFNELGMRVLLKANVNADQASTPQLIMAPLLYGRTLTSFQSAYLLTERGMTSDARTVVRAAAETAIILAAMVKDTGVCDLLVDRHYWHHRKLRTAWLKDPEAATHMTPQEMHAVEATITAANIEHPRAKTLTSDPINVFNLAQLAGVTALYNTVYRTTSGDAAHTSPDALDRLCRVDAQRDIIGFKFGPDVADLPNTLSDAISVLGHALNSILELLSLSQFENDLAQCIAAWKDLGAPAEDRK